MMDKKLIYYIWTAEQDRGNNISEKEAIKIFEKAKAKGVEMIHIESELYPDKLRILEKPPLVLYCIGNISLLNKESVAIVGTRRASAYGKWVTGEIAKVLCQCGLVHVSGMAEGIDSAGHREVINQGGQSIAVLGTGIDICFPKSSSDVYLKIREKGLIVSEYPPGVSGMPYYFPQRNRIISALADKVVIIEGALRSGSLITAKLALEQGKEIYAVPGNINQPNSIGPNILIADGAIPIVNLAEIAETLGIGFLRKKKAFLELKGLDKDVYKIIFDNGSLSVEDLLDAIDAPAETILARLTYLELQGILKIEGQILSLL